MMVKLSRPTNAGSSQANFIELLPAERAALTFLMPLSEDYPGIDVWFTSKVVPGLRAGTRFLLIEERADEIAGVGIAKNEPKEKKICTVRIAPRFVGRGLGMKLFDKLLYWLDVDKPQLTVSEKKICLFERVFEWYGFEMTSAYHSRYVPNIVEFGYNEPTSHLD